MLFEKYKNETNIKNLIGINYEIFFNNDNYI